MAASEVSASALAWSWVIEALASSREVDLGILHDLIGATPNMSDNLGKEATEMVALRCLEALYDPAKVFKSGTSLSCNQKEFQFDSSEGFSRVLQRVLDQTSVSGLSSSGSNLLANLRKGASDQLVREVQAFINCRKTSLPKCALEQLRDRIQKGNVSLVKSLTKICGPDVQSPNPEKRNKPLEEKLPSTMCLKRDRSCLQTEKHMQDYPIDVDSGKSPPRKKLRHDGNGSIASTELSEDASGRNVPHIEGGAPMGGRESRILSDGNERHVLSGKPAQPAGPHTCQHDVSSGDKMQTEETSHDKIVNHHEGTNFAVVVSENNLTLADSTELDVCMKCNEGGEMLVCSASSCQMVIHERCLGFPANIDSRGNFLCPFCACSVAVSEYDEAKKKMRLAREELSLFIGGNPGPGHRQVDQSKGLSNTNVLPPRQGRSVDRKSKVTPVDRTSKDKQPQGPTMQCEDILSNQKGKQQNRKGQQEMQIEHFRYAGLHGGNPKLRSLEQLHGLSKNDSHVSSGDINGTSETENFKANPSRNYSRPKSRQKFVDKMKNASGASLDGCDGTSEKENCGATTSKYSLRSQSWRKLPDQMKDASSVFPDDSDGTSEEENCRLTTSKYSLRLHGKETSNYNVNQAVPLDRRIRVPWTAEEVEMLKEGVKRFGSGDVKVIPWRTILEFGSSVFWSGRTSVDLKDKWRNLVRYGQIQS